MRKFLSITAVLVLALAGPVSTTVVPAANVSAVPTRLNYYESPCANQARTTRGIPPLTADQSRGLIAWERRHIGTAAARDYHAALDACQPVDWDSMVLAYTETIGR